MIVSLIPRTDFAPVPRIEVRLSDGLSWDGGAPDDEGPDEFDGGAPDANGAGYDAGTPSTVDVTVPEGTDSVTLWWSSEGHSGRVSGAIRRTLSSTFAHLDVEAGFDVPTAYEVECLSGGLSLGRIALGAVTLPWTGDSNGCLVQQPLDPYLHAVVTNLSGSWPSMTNSAPGETIYTQGDVYPSLIGFGPRRAATDVSVDFAVETREMASRLRATLGTEAAPQLPVWLIRSHHGFLPRRFFAHVQSLQEVDVDMYSGGEWSRFQSTVSEVARPAPGLVVAPLSYTDLDVSFDSYDDMDAAFPSYDARDTAFELAGASG